MAGNEEYDPYKRITPIDESLIIDTLRLEADRRQKEQDKKDEENRRRQADHDAKMLSVTIGLFCVTFLTAIAALYQAYSSSIASNAAQSAAETAAKTLDDMTISSGDTAIQIGSLIRQQRRTADSMEGTLRQSRKAMDASNKQSLDALNASI